MAKFGSRADKRIDDSPLWVYLGISVLGAIGALLLFSLIMIALSEIGISTDVLNNIRYYIMGICLLIPCIIGVAVVFGRFVDVIFLLFSMAGGAVISTYVGQNIYPTLFEVQAEAPSASDLTAYIQHYAFVFAPYLVILIAYIALIFYMFIIYSRNIFDYIAVLIIIALAVIIFTLMMMAVEAIALLSILFIGIIALMIFLGGWASNYDGNLLIVIFKKK